MPIISLIKASLAALALPPGLWVAGVSPGVASAAGFVAGALLVTWAWVHIAQPNRSLAAAPAPPVAAPAFVPAPTAEIAFPERRLDRPLASRGARDMRCPSSRSLARPQPARRRTDR